MARVVFFIVSLEYNFGKLIFTSYRWFVVYVVVGHRAVGLLQVVVTSPCRGGAAKIYN